MNKPREFKSGYFNAVLGCGYTHNRWLEIALKYLPEDLFDQNTKGFLFTSTVTRDACRVARHYCQTREIILISERILPGRNVGDETKPKARYFIYVVLHEIAHAPDALADLGLLDAEVLREYIRRMGGDVRRIAAHDAPFSNAVEKEYELLAEACLGKDTYNCHQVVKRVSRRMRELYLVSHD